jgi:WD40 repeat protein
MCSRQSIIQNISLRTWIPALVLATSLAPASLGCGSVSRGQPDAGAAPDGGGDVTPDAPLDAAPPRCDPTKPFGTPTLVPKVSSDKRDQGAILVDALTMYLGSDRGSATGLYMATRASPTSDFEVPTPLTAINTTGSATGPTVTDDGLTMYYALGPPLSGDIFVTTRASRAVAFPAGTVVSMVNYAGEDLDPYITPDGSTLYFDSAQGGTMLHLYMAVRQANGSFGTPQALPSPLNTAGVVDGHPVLTHDGLTLYWSSTRTDGNAQGGTDIWTATRPSTAGAFGAPVRVPELSSAKGESVSWIAPDNCSVFLQSDRAVPGALGSQDIFEAVRPM